MVRARRARLAPRPGGWSERPTARQTARPGPRVAQRAAGWATAQSVTAAGVFPAAAVVKSLSFGLLADAWITEP